MNFKVEHKPHDEVLKIIDNLAKEYIFVYTKETDRTRFIMTVLGKCVDAEDPDMIDRGVLVFEKGYDEEFTMGVMLEIADFLRDVNRRGGRALHLTRYHDATANMLQALHDFIID